MRSRRRGACGALPIVIAAAMGCSGKGDPSSDNFEAYANKSKAIEATAALTVLGRSALETYAEKGAFPAGKAGPTPATPCCQEPDKMCPVADWDAEPVWNALFVSMDRPTRFQYAYESDGQTATATATGDADCDGTPITFRLELSVKDGTPAMNLVRPTTPD